MTVLCHIQTPQFSETVSSNHFVERRKSFPETPLKGCSHVSLTKTGPSIDPIPGKNGVILDKPSPSWQEGMGSVLLVHVAGQHWSSVNWEVWEMVCCAHSCQCPPHQMRAFSLVWRSQDLPWVGTEKGWCANSEEQADSWAQGQYSQASMYQKSLGNVLLEGQFQCRPDLNPHFSFFAFTDQKNYR